ncbi:MAG: multi-sensor signal transduction histidine kinase [Marmoricola sp.]|jgi:signal transduction histidine kinase|nr:multi-sensor signal transduction histidine kinase [Marmoricola sp.]
MARRPSTDANASAARSSIRRRQTRRRTVERTTGIEQSHKRAELFSSISHELRTPLTSVIGYTEVLLSGDAGQLNDEQIAMLGRVSVNGERLLELIEGLLGFAHERASVSGTVDMADVFLQVMLASCEADEPAPEYAL